MFSKSEALHLTYKQGQLIRLLTELEIHDLNPESQLSAFDTEVLEAYFHPIRENTDVFLPNETILENLITFSNSISKAALQSSPLFGEPLRQLFEQLAALECQDLSSIENTLMQLKKYFPPHKRAPSEIRGLNPYAMGIYRENYSLIKEDSINDDELENLAECSNQIPEHLARVVSWAFKFEKLAILKELFASFRVPVEAFFLLLEEACTSQESEKISFVLQIITDSFDCQRGAIFVASCELAHLATIKYLCSENRIEDSDFQIGLHNLCERQSIDFILNLLKKKVFTFDQFKKYPVRYPNSNAKTALEIYQKYNNARLPMLHFISGENHYNFFEPGLPKEVVGVIARKYEELIQPKPIVGP